ncbi:tyrosine-type recombinase/integrase [Roseomonas sp. PWR1]|uniref:Tyrosine-type recombinase/integrase n=1 Tax=Roseomonas nitratireducens TaxID=2820810 RepID=A0ABS4AZ90_9PROT|nr:integrase family protein [Neoroseomonas nitratireducens]MBP0465867.1 tyrosine-type recombinase/integrase [Neoroseomonas nitratireducens]
MADRVNLTQAAVERLLAEPADRRTWDEKVRHLALRQRASGAASWVVVYRTTGGRRGSVREVTLGDARETKPEVARTEARKVMGQTAEGRDPAAERAAARAAMTVREAIEQYAATLASHRNHKTITSLLRRELAAQLGTRRLRDLTRADLIERISTVERDGRRGAAEMLRRDTGGMLNWAANTGLITASPLAGWRKPRATKAEMLEREGRAGRALLKVEVEVLHAARAALPHRESAFLLLLLATGMRRQEAERAKWSDITTDAHGSWLTIPAANAKNARAHKVFLVPTIAAALDALDRIGSYVFGGAKAWSDNRTRFNEAMNDAFAWAWRQKHGAEAEAPRLRLHDLRRTFRSACSEAGVETDLAEFLLNHVRDDLIERYDRADRLPARAEATRRACAWLLPPEKKPSTGKVVRLPRKAVAS